MTSMSVDDVQHDLCTIRETGDLILDVSFINTESCNRSIPVDTLSKLRTRKLKIPSIRVLYRVEVSTLKSNSKYFTQLLGSERYAEAQVIKSTLEALSKVNIRASDAKYDELPHILITDEDDATRTLGREKVFADFLRILHGDSHTTKNITLQYLAVLVTMADRFDSMSIISQYIKWNLKIMKYPQTWDKPNEETLRQKILYYYHTNQNTRLAATTRDLIRQGSRKWGDHDESLLMASVAWWNLPDSLEEELAYRRTCILKTIRSLLMYFINKYASTSVRICALGYDSSISCDSFQFGEMVRFLTKKGLLFLIPFQPTIDDNLEMTWPEAYSGEIENLITLLRQCPSYQIDKYHSHCGLRSKIIEPLDILQKCIDTCIGIDSLSWKTNKSLKMWSQQDSVSMPAEQIASTIRFFDEITIYDIQRRIQNRTYDTKFEKFVRNIFTAKNMDWDREK